MTTKNPVRKTQLRLYSHPPFSCSVLKDSLSVDVLVIGGGIAGLSAAYHLSEQGISSTLLEAEEIPSGASARAAGILVGTDEQDICEILDHKHGKALVQQMKTGVRSMLHAIKQHKIDCSVQKVGALYVATSTGAVEELHLEYAARKKLGDYVRLLPASKVPIASYDALLDPSIHSIDPVAFAIGLAHASKNCTFYRKSPVTKIDMNKKIAYVNGHQVLFKQVFVAAGIHTARLLGLDDVIYLKTSVIVTAPIPKLLEKQWLNKHAFWTSEEPGYTYGKITADNRILFGGEDTLVSPDEFSNKAENIAALKKKFKKLLPQFADVPIDYSWSGIIDVSPDLLPIVGKIKNGIYVAHSSLGLPSGFNSGRMVAASIAGENVPEMKLFSPTRKLPLHERAELLCNHKPFLWVANWYVRYKEHEND